MAKAETKKTSPTTDKTPEKANQTVEIKQNYLMTGLSDYGFWCQQVEKECKERKEPDPSFRRGRIW